MLVEKSRQIKPLESDEVKAFINFYARKKYENDEEKNDFFNSFINRVLLFDDKAYIFYNTSPDSQSEVKLGEQKGLLKLNDLNSLNRFNNLRQNGIKGNKKSNSSEPEFKRVALGGERGVRTPGYISASHAFQACAFDHSTISPKTSDIRHNNTCAIRYS